MQRWETPYMKSLVDFIMTDSPSRVLEVGFGMGISAAFIQNHKPKEHVIMEANHNIVKKRKEVGEWHECEDPRHSRVLARCAFAVDLQQLRCDPLRLLPDYRNRCERWNRMGGVLQGRSQIAEARRALHILLR